MWRQKIRGDGLADSASSRAGGVGSIKNASGGGGDDDSREGGAAARAEPRAEPAEPRRPIAS